MEINTKIKTPKVPAHEPVEKLSNESKKQAGGAKAIAGIACFLLCLSALCLAVGRVAGNPNFYAAQFKGRSITEELGITEADLKRFSDGLIDYFYGGSETLQFQISFNGEPPVDFYTEDELSHMADAKVIFDACKYIGWISLIIALAVIIALFFTRSDRKEVLSAGAIWGTSVFIGIGILLGLAMIINFDAAFTLFHEIFFPQGNWQFNTPMVQILTQDLFLDAAAYILIGAVSFTITLLAAGIIVRHVKNIKLKPKQALAAASAEEEPPHLNPEP